MKTRGRPPEGQYRIVGKTKISRDFVDLARRRVMPFMDVASIQTRPLELIMSEVYLQGIRDAVDAMEAKREREASNDHLSA